MLNLYIKTHCPYSVRVLEANKVIKAPIQICDININSDFRTELLTKGGMAQVPFLEDTERNVLLYESIDIIEYLKEHYGNGVAVAIKQVGNICPIE